MPTESADVRGAARSINLEAAIQLPMTAAKALYSLRLAGRWDKLTTV